MDVHRFWLLFPGSPSVLNIPNKLLLLDIYAHNGPMSCLKVCSGSLDRLKLRIAIWVSAAGFLFLDIDSEGVAPLAEQASKGGRTDAMPQVTQTLAYMS